MTLHKKIFETIEQFPARIAVVYKSQRWTYGELGQRTAEVREKLQEGGLSSGGRVILWMENSPEYVAAYLAVLAVGGIVVPLHPLSMPGEVSRIIRHVKAAGLITATEAWHAGEGILAESGIEFVLLPDQTVRFKRSLVPIDAPDGLAQIIYTSGTTGHPKGVMLSHRNLLANARSILAYLDLRPEDSILAVLPFVYSYGNSIMLTHLICGGKLVVENSLVYPKIIVDSMHREEVTGFSGVASTYALMLRHSSFNDTRVPSLRYFTSAGGPMPSELLHRVQTAFPGRDFIVMYGQTEASARLSYLPPTELERKRGSAGHAIPGVTLQIVRENGEVAGPGETGEIVARGESVMMGYWQDPDNTQKVLKQGALHTGDLGCMDEEGYIFITGRQSQMIKSGAYRISPNEIEEVLYQHSEVHEAGVVGMDDPILGEAVYGLVVPKSGTSPSSSNLLAHCAQHLAIYKRPKTILVVKELPKSPNGKILRQPLRDLCRSLLESAARRSPASHEIEAL